jgi:hypothetical protein
MDKTLEYVAKEIMCLGMTMQEINDSGWELRKNKTVEDIRKAITKAKKPKYGMLKTEYELEWAELFLKEVLKKKIVKREDK